MALARARTHELAAWEQAFILIALFFVTGSFEPILISFGGVGASLTESSPANLYTALVIYAVAIGLVLMQPGATWRLMSREPVILLLLALPLLSTFWSDDPTVTFRRAVAHAMTIAFCFYLAVRLSPQELMRALLWVLFLGGVASFIFTVVAPGQSIGHGIVNQGSWSGIYGHKANLGRMSAIAFFVALFFEPRSTTEMVMRWATIAMFLVLAFFSQSRAGWAIIGLGLSAACVLVFLRSRHLSASLKIVVSAAVAVIILASLIATADLMLEAVGRNESMSGRTKLWGAAIAVAEERHAELGAGYRNFWTEDSAAGVRSYIPGWVGLPGHGHNGYLDVWLELGIPGAILFLVFVWQAMTRLAARVWSGEEGRLWLCMSLLFLTFLINNFSASVALKHSEILWVLPVLISIYAHGEHYARVLPKFAWWRPDQPVRAPATRVARGSPALREDHLPTTGVTP